MKISKLSVRGLFGTFNYDITFEEDQPILMLTGPNGYGKTTLLRILNSLYRQDLVFFYQLEFEKIEVSFGNKVLTVESIYESEENNLFDDEDFFNDAVDTQKTRKKQVSFSIKSDGIFSRKEKGEYIYGEKELSGAVRNLGYYRRTSLETRDFTSNEFYEFYRQNAEVINSILSRGGVGKSLFMYLNQLKSVFIPSQRLYSIEKDRMKSTSIHDVVSELQKKMDVAYRSYLKDSQRKDSKFIDSFLTSSTTYSKEEYNQILKEVKEFAGKLNHFGLIEKTTYHPYSKDNAKVLSTYIKIQLEKLQQYKGILDKLELFSELLRSKKFINKQFLFSVEDGLLIKNNFGKFLDVNKLSSGEKNEIIMLYKLIFETEDKSLLYIDEPENSLHVAWQLTFIDELQRIAETKSLQVIVATHSPQIIAERWDDCFDLYENNIKE